MWSAGYEVQRFKRSTHWEVPPINQLSSSTYTTNQPCECQSFAPRLRFEVLCSAFGQRNCVLANLLKCACVVVHYTHAQIYPRHCNTWLDFARSGATTPADLHDLLYLSGRASDLRSCKLSDFLLVVEKENSGMRSSPCLILQ